MRSMTGQGYLLVAAVLLCAGGTAQAYPLTVLEANVPFAFVVNGQTLPAGKYRIERDELSPSVVVIRGEQLGHATALVGTMPDGGPDPAGSRPALTFKRDGDQYRLASVWEAPQEGWDVIVRHPTR